MWKAALAQRQGRFSSYVAMVCDTRDVRATEKNKGSRPFGVIDTLIWKTALAEVRAVFLRRQGTRSRVEHVKQRRFGVPLRVFSHLAAHARGGGGNSDLGRE